MYNEPIFLKPVLQERIWGGKKLRTEYGYDIPSEKTGEAWVISAHPNGPSVIKNGPLAGKTLTEAWEQHGDLFNKAPDNKEEYPLLVKILDANDDLSVQVHPDDQFAREVEGQPYGKTECWYVLKTDPDARLVLGHHANSREELEKMMDDGKWDNLLQYKKVVAGDFVYVPSGTIHAIGKGIIILETQQSSDITYRVYDYDRKDAAGQKRELHLDRAKQVTTVPHKSAETDQVETVHGDLTIKRLVKEQYFTVYHWELNGKTAQKQEHDFLQVSVIEGEAQLNVGEKSFHVEKGSHFILPSGLQDFELSGKAEFVASHI
ncbi:mannose-6-phosphate isomerase, class I [Virgibacillus profundi]|uniref:Mannose-6-phosphate isomerase n=1 Tax=Virgibacillus profundi TaxID=2024555 RepID=A0A2A2II47_9BACI|nr:mannose-6-phosphate isomerase, class I [Virgibacillus profundi]PAV30820.1 mannose-6-phosphate isomerase, class I [Virgibacillus profundi]PXY55003.1 mannose-6-phosphate isomerase, class I [Virgibacillus profundi]